MKSRLPPLSFFEFCLGVFSFQTLALRKLLKHCWAQHIVGNINAEKRKTAYKERARREKEETQGKAKQNTDFLSSKKKLW